MKTSQTKGRRRARITEVDYLKSVYDGNDEEGEAPVDEGDGNEGGGVNEDEAQTPVPCVATTVANKSRSQ